MRVLFWPMFTYPGNVNADSGYICVRNLVREIPAHWHAYVIMPTWEGKDVSDELDAMPNVTRVPMDMHTLFHAQEVVSDPSTFWRFSPQEGTIPVEAVVCSSPTKMVDLANAYAIRTDDHDRPLMVNWDLLARDDLMQNFRTNAQELMAVYAGVAMADRNVYGSPMMEWMTHRMTRKLLSPSLHREVIAKGETVFAGVPMSKIDHATAGVKKRDKFTVYYGGRFGSMKRVDDLAEVYDTAFRFGRDIEPNLPP